MDFTELLETWAAQNLHALTDETRNVTPAWRDATFTLKYCSDALFDFPYWFGFSKRTFKVSYLPFSLFYLTVYGKCMLTCINSYSKKGS